MKLSTRPTPPSTICLCIPLLLSNYKTDSEFNTRWKISDTAYLLHCLASYRPIRWKWLDVKGSVSTKEGKVWLRKYLWHSFQFIREVVDRGVEYYKPVLYTFLIIDHDWWKLGVCRLHIVYWKYNTSSCELDEGLLSWRCENVL